MKTYAHIDMRNKLFTIYTGSGGWLGTISMDLLNDTIGVEEAIQDWVDSHFDSHLRVDVFVYGEHRESVQVLDEAGGEVLRFVAEYGRGYGMRGGPVGNTDEQRLQLQAAVSWCSMLRSNADAHREDLIQMEPRR